VRAAGLERQVWLLRADATALPLRDRGIAGVALGEVLEHIPRDDLALAESARVLVEGGALALTVPAGSGRMGPIDHLAGHVRRYDRVPLARRVTDAGLTVTTLAGWGFPFGRLYDRWVQRPALLRRPGRARRAIGWLGRRRWVVAAWHAMFAVDARLPAGERGSGWLLVARKPAPAGRTTLVEPKV